MNHIIQKTNSDCGQSCVSMVAGVDLESIYQSYGHFKKSISGVIHMLIEYGFQCLHYDWNKKLSLKILCGRRFIAYYMVGKGAHYVVSNKGLIFDPANHGLILIEEYFLKTKPDYIIEFFKENYS